MGKAITSAGLSAKAQHLGNETLWTINKFVLANVAGLDPNATPEQNEVLPAAGDIVAELSVTKSGFVSPDKVVYSLLLDSAKGNYSFNWVGLVDSDDNLIVVEYLPIQTKTKTANGVAGNNLTRNFLLTFTGAVTVTNVTVEAETWQIDFANRLLAIDNTQRVSMQSVYGDGCFINDAFLVTNDNAVYTLSLGTGMVYGISVTQEEDKILSVNQLPNKVWVEASQQGDIDGVFSDFEILINNSQPAEYIDAAGKHHFYTLVATINPDGSVIDERTVITTAMVDSFSRLNHSHNWDDISEKPDSFAPSPHSHGWGQLTDIPASFTPSIHQHNWTDIQNRPQTFPPSNHSHNWDDLVNKPDSITANWNDLQNKPTTFAPSIHSHSWGSILNKPATFPPAAHAHNEYKIDPGFICALASTYVPTGWLECNGAAISRSVYAELFARISTYHGSGNGYSTFNIPDLRGEFIRGYDHGRGVDPSRNFGTSQSDSIKSHSHGVPQGYYDGHSTGTMASGDDYTSTVFNYVESLLTGSSETRPRNVALIYCIKY